LINFEKPLVAAVQGAAIGGGTTMLPHCDFVYAGESAKFQLPFVNLALVPEFGSSYLLPLRFGYTRAAELILLGGPFDASRAAELGLVTQVVPDQSLLATATETARTLAAKPAAAVQASKRLMKRPLREQLEQAVKLELEVFAERVRSDDAKEHSWRSSRAVSRHNTFSETLSIELAWGGKGELGKQSEGPSYLLIELTN